MNVDVVLEGKMREPYFKMGVDEFKKRLSSYFDTNLLEVNSIDEYIKNSVKTNDYIITLEIEGKMLSSEEFAKKIQEIESDGYYNRIVFLIGGSTGLSAFSRSKSNFKFSMSKLTFLHQEATMILFEQIYRSVRILNNQPYHK